MKKILVVEDEISLLNVLASKLTKEKFKVFKAKNGEEALKIALKEHPDLILLDILMPKMDGLEMLDRLRMDEWGKDAVVMILTNLGETEKTAEAMGKGVFEYMVKSNWKLEEVVKKITEKLKT